MLYKYRQSQRNQFKVCMQLPVEIIKKRKKKFPIMTEYTYTCADSAYTHLLIFL